MINEKAECGEYFRQWLDEKTETEREKYIAENQYSMQHNPVKNNKNRYSITYYGSSPKRVLRILARYYWYEHDEIKKIENVSDKIVKTREKLTEFFDEVVAQDYKEAEQKEIFEKNRKKYLRKRLEPYAVNTDNDFTFYSIIADAVNEGELLGDVECELTEKEILCVLNVTESVGSSVIPISLLALICYSKIFKKERELPDNYLPIEIPGMDAWFRSKKTWELTRKFVNKTNRFFFDIKNVHNINVRYRIDNYLLEKKWQKIVEDKKINIDGETKFKIKDTNGNLRKQLERLINNFKKF